MTQPPLVLCLSCHTPLQPGEMMVFRKGVKIAHVRCWRLDHQEPSSHGDSVAPPTSVIASVGT